MDEPTLTSKQQEVVKMLRQGKSPEQIARRMKITTNAVYGHVARMRRKGIEVPGGSSNGRSESANGHPARSSENGNGSSRSFDSFGEDLTNVEKEVSTAIEDIQARARGRLDEITKERHELSARLDDLVNEENTIREDVERAEKVKAALV